jgi:hypothetical protein
MAGLIWIGAMYNERTGRRGPGVMGRLMNRLIEVVCTGRFNAVPFFSIGFNETRVQPDLMLQDMLIKDDCLDKWRMHPEPTQNTSHKYLNLWWCSCL